VALKLDCDDSAADSAEDKESLRRVLRLTLERAGYSITLLPNCLAHTNAPFEARQSFRTKTFVHTYNKGEKLAAEKIRNHELGRNCCVPGRAGHDGFGSGFRARELARDASLAQDQDAV